MNHFVRLLGISLLLTAFAIVASPGSDAQDAKAQDPKADPAKQDDPTKKKDDKKDDKKGKTDPKKDKKDPKTDVKPKPPQEKLVYEKIVTAKIKKISTEAPNDFTIEVVVPDPVKVAALQQWQYERLMAIAQAKPQDRFKLNFDFQIELAKRQNDIYTTQDFDVRAVENVKVRTVDPPMEYDDKGFPKQWTPKELQALRGNSTLPGYPSTYEFVRSGQNVQVYLVRPKMVPRKKGEDPKEPIADVVMIVIGSQAK